jgi:anti-sigma B factor antagonist
MDMELTALEGGVTCARLHGRLDSSGADRIGIRFTAGVVAQGRPALVDLSGVSFIASMGIRLLISCAKGLKLKGAKMVLFGAQPMVLEVLEDAGLDQILDIVGNEQDALARVAAA